MYAYLWRRLPGPLGTRVGLAVALIAGVVVLLLTVVFPWVEPVLPYTEVVGR